ncbi:BA14K family protein [Chelativorans salis]|uniref:Lectin-like protein BA14k n=1 Tax=Chelativorans salis TaxID=2978478 RepID=A0ABT2LRQ7_9HYPH|nr:BA14K family protein [Chelativorans sp. EGI FJ00035]MCT7377154.1 BA14K family protein [Chelativorans sp. EGI FJ00035]
MKPLLAIIAGFLVSSAVFISGAAVATYLIMAEPVRKPDASQEVTDLQGQKPGAANAAIRMVRPVSPGGDQDIPDPESETQETLTDARTSSSAPVEEIDVISTSSIGAPNDADNDQSSESQETLSAAHIEWCSDRYRSYRPETNSYTPDGGGTRPCISPYATSGTSVSSNSGQQRYATNDGIILSPEHVQDCLRRYRSYRPEDNSYQPYGGGPRRQCR